MAMTFRTFEPNTTEYAQALQLRETMLRKPLGLTITEPELAHEADCFHLGGFNEAQIQAVLLLQPLDEHTVQMRQVAVSTALQGGGIGRQLIAFTEEFARQQGFGTMVAHARGTALGFYLRLGYTAEGEDFLEQTIPHRLVTKAL